MKRLSSQSLIGQQGINFVERIVLEMKFIWRPTPIFDLGIDGEIEICDPASGVATNSIIKVQVKATTTRFQAETPYSFEFPCSKKDIEYWLSGNAPVILIVCRPQENEAYWISLKDYFKDPGIQNTNKIEFDKQKNIFDKSSAAALQALALPPDIGVYFSPQNISETLFTNLLKVQSYSNTIYTAETEYRDRRSVWDKLNRLSKNPGGEWILKNKMIISFRPLNEFPFNQICDPGTCEQFGSDEWACSLDEDRKRDFVQLLNLCLRQRACLHGLRYHAKHEYYYFPASRDFATKRITYKSMRVTATREVFKQYYSKKNPDKKTYCRHAAFKGIFLRLGDFWYLEITPTYHFTIDGKNDYPYREELLKGIKRLERNPAVVGQLLMWSNILQRPTTNLFNQQEYEFLLFGDLERVSIDAGINDDDWYEAEEPTEKQALSMIENQPRFLGI